MSTETTTGLSKVEILLASIREMNAGTKLLAAKAREEAPKGKKMAYGQHAQVTARSLIAETSLDALRDAGWKPLSVTVDKKGRYANVKLGAFISRDERQAKYEADAKARKDAKAAEKAKDESDAKAAAEKLEAGKTDIQSKMEELKAKIAA